MKIDVLRTVYICFSRRKSIIFLLKEFKEHRLVGDDGSEFHSFAPWSKIVCFLMFHFANSCFIVSNNLQSPFFKDKRQEKEPSRWSFLFSHLWPLMILPFPWVSIWTTYTRVMFWLSILFNHCLVTHTLFLITCYIEIIMKSPNSRITPRDK